MLALRLLLPMLRRRVRGDKLSRGRSERERQPQYRPPPWHSRIELPGPIKSLTMYHQYSEDHRAVDHA